MSSSPLAWSLSRNREIEKKEEEGAKETKEAKSPTRKLSEASLSSAECEGEEREGSGEMTTEEEEEEEEKDVVLLGPQATLKEQLELDKDDDSLRRWKENLLGSWDLSTLGETAEPEVKILSLTIMSPDRPDLILPLPFASNNKGNTFTLKDGSRYRIKFTFTASNNIVSGLKYTNTVWKTGVKVDSTKVMLGTFSPRLEPYTYELEEETTPSGYFARGSYSARAKFVDDDGKCHLDLSYCFEIGKDWPAS